MSDQQVVEALHSNAPLVLVEAPAGFGKTFQGAQYAKYLLPSLSPGRLLILAHTNAACDVFTDRTRGFGGRVEIRTIDSLIMNIAIAYHKALRLPPDVPNWVHQQGQDGFNKLAVKVSNFLAQAQAISAALSCRYPYVVCDEHQDTSEAQHQIILSISNAGAFIRIFGDPMQAIYENRKDQESWNRRWAELQDAANCCVALNTPHRWKDHSLELGEWISKARKALKAVREIDLRGELPRGLTLIRADNIAQRHGQYMLSSEERRPIDSFVKASSSLLVLASTNDTVRGLRAFFNRSIPIWEGHTRDSLSTLFLDCLEHSGRAVTIAESFIKFVQSVACGFSNTSYGNILRREVNEGCRSARRQKSACIQEIARLIIECPDHRGVAQALAKLGAFIDTDKAFNDIKLDLKREFREAARLAQYEDANAGLAELALRRTVFRVSLPSKVISTIHKAKGHERENVIIMPCDEQHFGDSDAKRRLLYVALSRAIESLALVIPRNSPSPLFLL